MLSRPVSASPSLALGAALLTCFAVSGCSWLSGVLAQTPALAPVEAVPRATAIVQSAEGLQFVAAGATSATGAVALPAGLAQPSRFIGETTSVPPPQAAPVAEPGPAVAFVDKVGAPAPAAAPQGAVEGTRDSALLQRLESWRRSWESGRFESYSRFYDGGYRGISQSRAAWESARKERLGAGNISVKLTEVRTAMVGPDEVRVEFVQQYASAKHRDTGHKSMTLRRDATGSWVIVEESWRSKA